MTAYQSAQYPHVYVVGTFAGPIMVASSARIGSFGDRDGLPR